MNWDRSDDLAAAVAVIGMSGRFPGAADLSQFWKNLAEGVESITFFTDEELAGGSARLADPRYVPAKGVLDGVELFDASFFGYTPAEAAAMDPQHRLFLECATAALEQSGYDPDRYSGAIGVYAGLSQNTYLLAHHATPKVVFSLGTDKDFLSTRLSYKLNLRGPSVVVQTACSTSLVAVCQACQSLLGYHCDIALAGGVSITVPTKAGYFYREGGILSPDGHCRAFDEKARGTVGGNGVGVVTLKRLADALEDGDTIWAVVRGSAINNDGSFKMGYTAPGLDGQAQVIATAQGLAGVNPDTISYIEAHGTATELGDPVEVAALTQAFRFGTERNGFCAIGSVKTNIGHLDSASGIAGFIKTVLALRHRQIPPSLHFERPNPKIEFERTPFYVNTRLVEWPEGPTPRRAGVSSFGIGGTNAHVVLEEAPTVEPSGASKPWSVLVLSAKTSNALDSSAANLAGHLATAADLDFADAAFTLQVGRKPYQHRRAIVCRGGADAIAALQSSESTWSYRGIDEPGDRRVVFMFPDLGEDACALARSLRRTEPAFETAFQSCVDAANTRLKVDLVAALDSAGTAPSPATTAIGFAVEYSLARLWMSWGVQPAALIGRGSGELVAACLSEALGLEDGFEAASSGPSASGRSIVGAAPRIPCVSNSSGDWISASDLEKGTYWNRRQDTRFDEGIDRLLAWGADVFLEVGPGHSLSAHVRQRVGTRNAVVISNGGPGALADSCDEHLARGLARLWVAGVKIDWRAYHGDVRRQRVVLPTYPFERKKYWYELPARARVADGRLPAKSDPSSWLYIPSWKRANRLEPPIVESSRWLVFVDAHGIGDRLVDEIARTGRTAVRVRASDRFNRQSDGDYTVNPASRDDYRALFEALSSSNRAPDRIVHMLGVEPAEAGTPSQASVRRQLEAGFYSVLHLVQALGECRDARACRLSVVASAISDVGSGDAVSPGWAPLAGLCRVIPQEYPGVACRIVDVAFDEWTRGDVEPSRLLAELDSAGTEPAIALRGGERWVQSFEATRLGRSEESRVKSRGVYLITGGLGPVGLTLATHLARSARARLVLTGRHGLPDRARWSELSQDADDQMARRIRAVRSLEDAGAEVLVVAADAADENAMRSALDLAISRFGGLDGVIHAAGTTASRGFVTIPELTSAVCDEHFRAKVDGLLVLDRLLADRPLDFCLLTSSISSVLGGFRFGAYAAANAFMDAFARKASRAGWVSVAWDAWRFDEEAAPTESAIAPAEGVDVFERILGGLTHRQILVSTSALDRRLEKWVDMRSVRETAQPDSTERPPLHPRPNLHNEYVPPRTDLERTIVDSWRDVLGVDPIGIEDNFFELGGDSFRGLQIVSQLSDRLGRRVAPVSLFEGPTVAALAALINQTGAAAAPAIELSARRGRRRQETNGVAQGGSASPSTPDQEAARIAARAPERSGRDAFAIIGMSGRFPGASSLETFWQNLRDGVEARTTFTDDELRAAGVPHALKAHPRFVRSGFVLDDIDKFDADFFGINPREAEVLDPQQRLFLECAWEALESAGYDSESFGGAISVFAGTTYSGYLSNNVSRNSRILKTMGARQSAFGSVADYMVTRVSYKLNLRGPCYVVQTACSTSLVAVHLACQSLASHESDIALAGGVSITVPHRVGYFYEEGGMLSPDGRCRAFDANAAGTAFGSGVGIVVLKRLRDALADGDVIHAVIRGSATNNDGSLKVGFTAPSVAGQAQVIAEAMAAADVTPDSISYVEAHGTGTELGDPVEIAALTRAFRAGTDRKQFCAIGSVKPNIGHLDSAAGVSSLIKTALALEHAQLPPSINFDGPNPKIEFDDSPFFVNTALRPWVSDGMPRRAGVSSFGFGGTNAHVVLEEAPVPEPSGPSRSHQLLVVSARTETALDEAASRLADRLIADANPNLADVAYTLRVGRRPFAHRRAILCDSLDGAIEALQGRNPRFTFTGHVTARDRHVVFLFPGQGSQYVNMGLDLYNDEPRYREIVDDCAEQLRTHLGLDLRDVIYADGADSQAAADRLMRTEVTQSALFVTEYALARLWMSWGVKPAACIGHSIGEFVAACIAGVFSLPDALRLVSLRGRLMEQMPAGVMVAVPLSEDEVRPLLSDGLWLSAVNAPGLTVVSGDHDRIESFTRRLVESGREFRRLHTSHAFHSGLMEGAVAPFVGAFASSTLSAPRIPFISNVTGDWITDSQAIDPAYWGRHIRQAVRFSDGITRLLEEPDRVFLEVGPGNTLGGLVRQHTKGQGAHSVFPSLGHAQEQGSDVASVLTTLGRLWIAGAAVSWPGFHGEEKRRRVALPTYPFERQRFWVEPDVARPVRAGRSRPIAADEVSSWCYAPSWKRAVSSDSVDHSTRRNVLLFVDRSGVADRIVKHLAGGGHRVVAVEFGDAFARTGDTRYTINPHAQTDYSALLRDLREDERLPDLVGHFGGVTRAADPNPDDATIRERQERGFYSLLYLAQAIGDVAPNATLHIGVVTDGVHQVTGSEPLSPEKATALGPCLVIPQEFAHLSCRNIDLPLVPIDVSDEEVGQISAELLATTSEPVVALRGGRRWIPVFDPLPLPPLDHSIPARLRIGGTYLITGGTGGIGLELARYLAHTVKARLVLTSRRGLPPRDEWATCLERADGPAAAKIRLVLELERAGAQVVVSAADVTDEDAMRALVDDAVVQFGRIDGVIHAAGIAGGGMIQLKKAEAAAAVLAPKVVGARVLARVFEGRPPDFMVLCSSLVGVLGGAGQVDYCGANAYLDAFARHHSATTKTFAVSVNWNAWREVGMAVETPAPDDLAEALKQQALAAGLSSKDGVDAFLRILSQRSEHQVAVSSTDINVLLEEVRSAKTAWDRGESEADAAPRTDSHPRPSLQNAFVGPRNATETHLCSLWQDSLGLDRVGIDDSFFDLGGHSLLAVRVMTRLNESLRTEIPVAKLYEGLTVRYLAQLIDRPAEAAGDEDAGLQDRRKDNARRRREHQLRRRVVMGR